MATKRISEDQIGLVINAKVEKAQQNIHQFSKEVSELSERNKDLRSQMNQLEIAGKKNTEEYKQRRAEYQKNGASIRQLKLDIEKETKSLDVNSLTMSQLRKQAKELQRQLDNTSKAADPKLYAELESSLHKVSSRMTTLREDAKSFKETFLNANTMSVMAGTALAKLAGVAGNGLRKIVDGLQEGINKGLEMAEQADGITHAFNQINRPGLLNNLRSATKDTVSDVELMKAAVRARDFRIPLEDLGKYLSFAQLKAQQTGQSLDYMVDSIVTGLGRQSPMILDNLGLSAAEISEKTKETGDFMKAVASIVENSLASAGETYISAADRAQQRVTNLVNAQKTLGDELLPLKEKFSDAYGQVQISTLNAIKYLVQHRETIFTLIKVVGLLTTTYVAYVAGQKLAHLWSSRQVLVNKLEAAALAVKNTMLELSVLHHAVLNGTMTKSIALQKAFNIVLKLSPWGLVFGGITLVIGALTLFRKKTDAVIEAQKQIKNITDEANKTVEEERVKIEMLTKRIHDNSLSLGERRDAIASLQKIVPDYTAKISREGKVYDESTDALTRYLNALQKKALLEGAQTAIKDLGRKKADLMIQRREAQDQLNEMKKEQAEFTKNNANRFQTSSGPNAPSSVYSATNYSANVYTITNKIDDINNKIKTVDTSLNAINKEFGKNLFSPNANTGNTGNAPKAGTIGAELDHISAKIDELKAKRLTINVGDTKALKAVDNQITALEKRKQILEGGSGNSGKAGGHAKDPDTPILHSFSSDRSQDIDTAKLAYEEDVNALKQALAEKKLTQEQYNSFISALNIEHQNNLLDIEKSYQVRSESLQLKDATKKKDIQDAQNKAVADQQNVANEAYVEAEKQYADVMDRIRSATGDKPQTLQEECDAKLLVLQGYYQASLQFAQGDNEKQLQAKSAYEAAKAAIEADYAKKKAEQQAQARQEYGLNTFDDELEARRKKIDDDYKAGIITSEADHQQALINLEQQAEERKLQIRQQYGLASQQELFNAEMEQLKLHLQNKELTQEEYEEAVKSLKISKAKETFDYFADLSGGAVKALQDAEEANVDAKYDAEIEAAKNAGKDTTEIEKKKANEKLQIQKKYADVNFAIKASQIIADTAVAIMKALGELGPIAGPIAAALMGVTGAAQLAAANAERQRVKKMSLSGSGGSAATSNARVATGLESGGSIDVEREQDGQLFHAAYDPNRRGFVDRPTVIVGEGPVGRSREWVASNAAVENPTVAPIIDIIDRAQRAGTIRMLDMNKFILQQTQGRQSGGSVAPSMADVRSVAQDSYKDTLLTRVYDLLEKISSEGIPASVALDELDRKQQLRDRSRNFGSKKN